VSITSQSNFASLFQGLKSRTRVRVTFNHSAGTQVIDLLGAGPLGGTCYMDESSTWPRSFRYAEILAAQVLS